jgi:hypothetical protein
MFLTAPLGFLHVSYPYCGMNYKMLLISDKMMYIVDNNQQL